MNRTIPQRSSRLALCAACVALLIWWPCSLLRLHADDNLVDKTNCGVSSVDLADLSDYVLTLPLWTEGVEFSDDMWNKYIRIAAMLNAMSDSDADRFFTVHEISHRHQVELSRMRRDSDPKSRNYYGGLRETIFLRLMFVLPDEPDPELIAIREYQPFIGNLGRVQRKGGASIARKEAAVSDPIRWVEGRPQLTAEIWVGGGFMGRMRPEPTQQLRILRARFPKRDLTDLLDKPLPDSIAVLLLELHGLLDNDPVRDEK